MSRGKSFTRRTKYGKLVCKVSKVNFQIVVAIIVSLIMNIPYYFQYKMVPCHKLMKFCNCTAWEAAHYKFHPFSLRDQQSITRLSYSEDQVNIQNQSNFEEKEIVYWMHCRSEFSTTLFWKIWYYSYEVSLSYFSF